MDENANKERKLEVINNGDVSLLPANFSILNTLTSMRDESIILYKQSQGLTQKFIDDWNRKWAEEIKRKEKPSKGVNFVFKAQRKKRRL